MAFTRKNYAGAAPATTLSGSITPSSTTFTLASGAGYPTGATGPFVLVTDPGTASEEKILCSLLSGSTVTVASSGRGYDGTTATSHSSGAVVNHVLTAIDLDEANQAVVNTIGAVTAVGDLLVGTGTNALGRVAIGTAGQVPTVVGGTLAYATPIVLDSTAADITPLGGSLVAGGVGKAADAGHVHTEGMSGVLTWMSL